MNKRCKVIGVSMFGKYFAANGCEVIDLYKKINKITKIVKRLDGVFHLFPNGYFFNDMLLPSCREDCDTAIIFDFFNANNALFHSILREVRAKRKIIFLWNTIESPLENIPDEWEIWTFDTGNAKQFGYKYGGTFYPIQEYGSGINNEQLKYDVFFAGLDKGRRAKIEELERDFDNLNITYRMDLMSRKVRQILFDRYVMPKPYSELIKCIKESKAILDITKEGQSGLTLRVLESLVFRKKLITNNRCITNLKIYSPRNIFVLGKDDINTLPTFIDTPCSTVNFDITEYDISNWLDRILNNEQFTYEQNGL